VLEAKTISVSSSSIGFGLERLTLPILTHPFIGLCVVIAIMVGAALAATQLRFTDDATSLFRGEGPAYRHYTSFLQDFIDASDVGVLLVDGDLSEARNWKAFRNYAEQVARFPVVMDSVSIFSIERMERVAGRSFENVFDGLPSFDAAEPDQGLRADGVTPGPLAPTDLALHPLNQGRYLTEDLRSAVILVRLDQGQDALLAAREFKTQSAKLAETIDGVLLVIPTGPAVVRLKIVDKIIAQQPLLLLAGLVVGFGLGVFLLGRWSDAVVVAAMPVFSILGIYGAFGALGIPMTVLINNLPLLVLALAFANSTHLVYAARRDLYAADYDFAALRNTMLRVGPAVALSTLTTAIAFLSFLLSGSEAIAEFGLIGASAVMGVLASALLFHPVSIWVALTLGWRPVPPARDSWLPALRVEQASGKLARLMFAARWPVSALSVLVAGFAAFAFSQLQPSFSVLDEVPATSRAYQDMTRLDRVFGGSQNLQLPLPIELPASFDQAEGQLNALSQLELAHLAAERALPGHTILSPWSLVRWLQETNRVATSRLIDDLVSAAPELLTTTILSRDGRTPALFVGVHATGNHTLLETARTLESAVGEALSKDMRGATRGLPILGAQRSGDIISRLSASLIAAAIGAALLAAFAFRSAAVFFVTILPNLLPVLMIGALLSLMDQDLRFASALAMTVALGIAVDDTVHVMNGFWWHRKKLSVKEALEITMREVGPVLVTTTLVLCLGLTPALWSWSPAISVFAALAITTIGVALIADMISLPALLSFWGHRQVTPRSTSR